MINFGAVPAGSVLPVFFDAFAGATGASITISGLAVTDIEVYKGTSVTQRSSDAGYALIDTDGIDIDGITGIHGFSIDTGDNTDSGFYSVGSFFNVVVSAITVDGQTVNFLAATFRLTAAEAVAGKPKVDVDAWLGTAAATPTVAGVPEVDVTHFGGTAGTFASGIPEARVASIANGAITAAAVATDAIDADALADGAITAATFAAGAITATVIATDAIDADALADNAITAATFAADAITAAKIAADVTTELQSGLATAANLATVAGYLDTEVAAIMAVTDKLDDTLEDDGGTYRFTTNALEQAPSGGGGTSDWTADERTAIRTILGVPASGTTPDDPTDGILDDIRDSVATRASQASVDTIDNFIDTEIATLQTSVDDLPTNAELATALGTADDAVLAAIATVQSDTNDIQTRLPAALTADGNIKADVLRINGSAESAVRLSRSTRAIVTGTATTGGSTTTMVVSALSPASAVNDQFNGRIITFDEATTTAALRGQATDITDFDHGTQTFSFTALTTAPASGDTFTIT
jgi:hypothetical protein